MPNTLIFFSLLFHQMSIAVFEQERNNKTYLKGHSNCFLGLCVLCLKLNKIPLEIFSTECLIELMFTRLVLISKNEDRLK